MGENLGADLDPALVGEATYLHDRGVGRQVSVHLTGDPEAAHLRPYARRDDDLDVGLVRHRADRGDVTLQLGQTQVEAATALVDHRGVALGHPPAPTAPYRVLVRDLKAAGPGLSDHHGRLAGVLRAG